MEPDELLRLALLEHDHATLKGTVDSIAHDVRLIRDAVLTDAATRRGRGKTLAVMGATSGSMHASCAEMLLPALPTQVATAVGTA